MGILPFREKWTRLLGPEGFHPREEVHPHQWAAPIGPCPGQPTAAPALPANILPTRALAARIREEWTRGAIDPSTTDRLIGHGRIIRFPWEISQHNGEAIWEDYAILTAGRTSRPLPSEAKALHPKSVFIEERARLSHCVLDATNGPIYITV